MAKAEIKTKPARASVDKFLTGVADEQQRADAKKLVDMIKRITGEEPKMWAPRSSVSVSVHTDRRPPDDRLVLASDFGIIVPLTRSDFSFAPRTHSHP